MAMRSLLSPVSVSVTLRMESTRGATRCFYASMVQDPYDDKRDAEKKPTEEEAEEKKTQKEGPYKKYILRVLPISILKIFKRTS